MSTLKRHSTHIVGGAAMLTLVVAVSALTSYLATPATASIPSTNPLFYSGTVTDAKGAPSTKTTADLKVALYHEKSGVMACSTTALKEKLVASRFRIKLDSTCLPVVQQNRDLLVEVVVNGTSTGKTEVGASPFAVNTVPVGTVLPYAGDKDNVPKGWLLCTGASVKQSDYPDLYKVIGTYYGKGSASGEFNLPDYQGRFLRGVDHTGKVDPDIASRTTNNNNGGNTGKSAYKVGSMQGYSSSLPNNPIKLQDTGAHTHKVKSMDAATLAYGSSGKTQNIWYPYGGGSQGTSQDGVHTHNVTGGDKETRPTNVYVNFIIKY